MKPIKVMVIVEAATITGPAKNVIDLARRLRQTGEEPPVEIQIVTFQRNGERTVFADAIQKEALPLFSIPERGRFDWSVIAKLSELVQALQPDIIESHSVKSHFLVWLARLKRFAPWIAFHHGYTWPDVRMRLYNQFDRWSLRGADYVLTMNHSFRDTLVRQGVRPERIEVVHNPIDPGWATAQKNPEEQGKLRTKLGIPTNHKILLIVGRLSQEKDHDTLLKAHHHLQKAAEAGQGPNVHLLIVGDGPKRQALEAVVEDLGLRPSVTFVGQVQAVQAYYHLADICVLSSLSEGSPNALLEAMAAGIPVVATRVGGVPEIVSHLESALLVAPRDWVGMAEAIRSLVAQPDLSAKLTRSAVKRIESRHSPEEHRRRLQRIYSQIALNSHAAKNPA